MKKLFQVILLWAPILVVNAQTAENIKEHVLFGKLGLTGINLKGYLISGEYQQRFSKSFAYGIFISHAWRNTYPDFFDDKEDLNDFLMSQRYSNINLKSGWEKHIYTSGGMKFYYSPINKTNIFVSVYMGLGISREFSSLYWIPEFAFNPNNGHVLWYKSEQIDVTNFSGFFMPGIFINFCPNQKYIIGVDASMMSTFSQSGYYSISFVVGFKL